MLFAAKIVAEEPASIQAVIPGTLVITNITLDEDSTNANLYLQASQEKVLIVALAESSLTAYHTELRLNLSQKGKHVLNAKNGSIYVVGHFSPLDPTKKITSIDEALIIKRGNNTKQAIKANPSTTTQHERKEVQQKNKSDEEDEPPKRSIRVKNAQPAKPQLKQKKEAKTSNKHKGNSLLEMMYNMNDDDDDDESDYSQESQQQSDSSSSSEEEDSDEPKRNTSKRTTKQQKIQRKEEDSHRPQKIWDEIIDTIEGNKDEDHQYALTQITTTQPHIREEPKASQQQNVVQDLSISNYTQPVQAEMKSSLQRISKIVMKKIMQELPPPPTPSSKSGSSDGNAYEQGWLTKYRKVANLFQKQISSLTHQSQITRNNHENQLLLQSQRLREQINTLRAALKEASVNIQAIKKNEGEEKRRGKAVGREQERSFSYRLPTAIPEFALRK